MNLGIEIAGGTVLLISIVLTIVLTAVGRAMKRGVIEQRTALESEGIELDGGAVPATIRYRNFRLAVAEPDTWLAALRDAGCKVAT